MKIAPSGIVNLSLLNMLAKYFSIIRNYVLSFRTNSGNIIGRNPSMVIPLLANQDLTPMLLGLGMCTGMHTWCRDIGCPRCESDHRHSTR